MENWNIDSTKFGKMKIGMFNNSSYYGIPTNILKSGICKYYRRKEWEKFEWCVVEMFILGLKNKAIITNLVNRLKILLMEEIICVEIGSIFRGIEILESVDEKENEEKLSGLLEFCRLVRDLKRGRIVSYINNFWRFEEKKYKLDDVILNKVKKFEKKGDSEKILKLGELFIGFLEHRDFNMFGVFNLVYIMDEKGGTRFRRKDCIYLLVEILEEYFENEKLKKVLEFGKKMLFRKDLKERLAFGMWLIVIGWKMDELDFTTIENVIWTKEEVDQYMVNRIEIKIDDDYVVNDYHVNKKFGLKKFGEVGSLVLDEDLSLLGEKGEEMRKFYIDVKSGIKKKKVVILEKVIKKEEVIKKKKVVILEKVIKKKKVKKKKVILEEVVIEEELESIDWSKFKNIEVIEEGVCGLKVCCIKVEYDGKKYILKEMKESFRFGRDYIMMDILKKRFGIKDLGMKRIRSGVGLEVVDKKKKTYVKNWKFGEREVVYCMMENFDNIGDLGKNKGFLEREDVFKESLKIRLFDGLFRSSDNILRNILVNIAGVVLSIDEGDIYGKRSLVFNKSDWFLKKENIEKTKLVVEEIINEWDLLSLKLEVEKEMIRFGFEEKVKEMKDRFDNYLEKVFEEF
uniref:Uncharacterized protein n=1 Tax=viral metagenome TaxID=1070528 RepID=A0A6C0J763_9ZZZZ